MTSFQIIERCQSVVAAADIDKPVRNKWKWSWTERELSTDINKKLPKVKWASGPVKNFLGDFIRKINQPGKAVCTWCNRAIIDYSGRGCGALIDHANGKKHVRILHTRLANTLLPGTSSQQSEVYGLSPMFSSPSKDVNRADNASIPSPVVHVNDRVTMQESLVLGVLAENSLPFHMSDVIIETAKQLAKDPHALSRLSLCRTTASYKMRYGLAKTIHERTVETLKETHFSLNIDESMSSNHKKVLTLLVSYFSDEKQEVVIEHLASVSLTTVNSQTLFDTLCDVFEEHQIPWDNLMSVMMDSCSVMRGCKSGLEQKIRQQKAPHLLDIDGDSSHHLHNAAKKFCEPFCNFVENLFKDLYNDHKYSPDLRAALSEICELLSIKFTAPDVYIPWRWLSCYDASVGTMRLLDAYIVFYYSFLKKDDQRLYKDIVQQVFEKRKVSEEAQRGISVIQKKLKEKNLTRDGMERKRRIYEKLFYKPIQLRLTLYFYAFGLETLKKYVCLFQSQKPMLHKLNDKQIDVFRELFSAFVKPEHIATASVKDLISLDLNDDKNLLKSRDMLFGPQVAYVILKSARNDKTIINDFFVQAKKAYVQCGTYLQKKLPLKNKFLQAVSAIDPLARGNTETLKLLKLLPTYATTVLNDEEYSEFCHEVHLFQSDPGLPLTLNNGHEIQIDLWWRDVSTTGKYPGLCKIVKALLSCFHGAQVESSFSTMNDIIDSKSGNIRTDTYSSIQTVKYHLRSCNKTALQFFERDDHLHDPVDTKLIKNVRGAKQCYISELKAIADKKADKQKNMLLNSSNMKVTKQQAKRSVMLANKVSRKAHLALKRKKDNSNSSGAKRRKSSN